MPLTPSLAAASEHFTASEQSVYEVGAIAASFGFFGVIWLDRQLLVLDSYGWLVDFVQRGQPVTDSILPVIGLEDEIIALRNSPDRVIELPAVAVAEAGRTAHKMNFTFFWNSAQDGPIVLAYRSSSQTELEIELSKQIRARLMAEAEVTAKSKELARANADLESFAAIVSHDLKAPLRHVRCLAEAAAQDPAGSSDAELLQKLHDIEAQAQRMSQMLTALFDYSELGRKYEALEIVDTLALMETIRRTFSRSSMAIKIDGQWPALSTLKALLDLVLRNLINNAAQHHDRDSGVIVVACRDSQQALVMTVSDDGPGIAAEHHASIFLPFRTLACVDTARSTGMGLAMVKKAVESAGGTISVASNPALQRGTTFTIHWPKYISL